MPVTVIASPAERFILAQIIFQADEEKKPLLEVHNAEQGRAFRRFIHALGLEQIRHALGRYGRVSDELARDESYSVFEVSDDAIEFFKSKILNLPRTALYEAIVGDLCDSLHGIGPGPYGRDDLPAVLVGKLEPGAEEWAPRNKLRPASGMWIPFTPLQMAMDEFSHAIEVGAAAQPLPPDVQAAIEVLNERMGGLVRAALATTT